MAELLERIQRFAAQEEVLISEHGYDELAAEAILREDVIVGTASGGGVEEYPDYHKAPCVQVL